jgi:hypothetical protein
MVYTPMGPADYTQALHENIKAGELLRKMTADVGKRRLLAGLTPAYEEPPQSGAGVQTASLTPQTTSPPPPPSYPDPTGPAGYGAGHRAMLDRVRIPPPPPSPLVQLQEAAERSRRGRTLPLPADLVGAQKSIDAVAEMKERRAAGLEVGTYGPEPDRPYPIRGIHEGDFEEVVNPIWRVEPDRNETWEDPSKGPGDRSGISVREREDKTQEILDLFFSANAPLAISGINPRWLRAIAVNESSLNPFAKNPGSTSRGLFGILTSTAGDPAYGAIPLPTHLQTPTNMAIAGRNYFEAMLKRYNYDPRAASMAYKMGPTNFDDWIRDGADLETLADFDAAAPDYMARLESQLGTEVFHPLVQSTIQGDVQEVLPPAATAGVAVPPEAATTTSAVTTEPEATAEEIALAVKNADSTAVQEVVHDAVVGAALEEPVAGLDTDYVSSSATVQLIADAGDPTKTLSSVPPPVDMGTLDDEYRIALRARKWVYDKLRAAAAAGSLTNIDTLTAQLDEADRQLVYLNGAKIGVQVAAGDPTGLQDFITERDPNGDVHQFQHTYDSTSANPKYIWHVNGEPTDNVFMGSDLASWLQQQISTDYATGIATATATNAAALAVERLKANATISAATIKAEATILVAGLKPGTFHSLGDGRGVQVTRNGELYYFDPENMIEDINGDKIDRPILISPGKE